MNRTVEVTVNKDAKPNLDRFIQVLAERFLKEETKKVTAPNSDKSK